MVHLFPSNLRFNACIPVQGIIVGQILNKLSYKNENPNAC